MDSNPNHTFLQLGVWTIVFNKPSLIPSWLSSLNGKFWKESGFTSGFEKNTMAYLWRFVKEVYSLGPLYFLVEIFLNVWQVVSNVTELYFTSSLLKSVTQSLESRELDSSSIVQALAGKLLLSVIGEYVSKQGEKYRTILEERVKYHFIQKAMHHALYFDQLTLEDPEVKSKVGSFDGYLMSQGSEAYEAFRDLLGTTTEYFRIVAEISFMFRMFRSSGLTLPMAFALCRPILNSLGDRLYARSFVAFCSNFHFPRMASLHSLAFDRDYREDRLTNNLGHYIEKEFKKSRQALGDTCTESFHLQWYRNRSITWSVVEDFTDDSTLLLFALRMLWNFGDVSIDELILAQQSSRSIQGSVLRTIYSTKRIAENLRTIRNSYGLADVQNKIKDGDLPYPLYSEERNHSGAEIEFRNVSFTYPGTDTNALTDVSFKIKPGQLVVIVGVNGSGKSSAIKLLTRLYDPLSGEILLDGRPLPSYRLEDVRRATAILRQDHPVLPLSLRENVALGLPERNADDDEVRAAIYQGGAEKLVQKLKNGVETILEPVYTVETHFVGEADEELKKIVDEKEIETDLSGGETQRLSASRIFMRLMGGNIRLLVADEPTSALDPEGEYELFRKLREHSGGKTVIFVTHRFGHLTKYADLILCLKDSELVEQGNHEELMAVDGEYKKLYSLQARAFLTGTESE